MFPSPDLSLFTTVSKSARYNIFTLYLFSKTDIKTTFIPVTFLAVGCAPLCNIRPTVHAIQCMFWLWLQLLHFNLANQTSVTSLEEDCRNKPFRPLPSGRLTLHHATALRYLVLFCGLSLSAAFGLQIFLINVGFAGLIVMYHDFHGDSHWLSKNLMNAFGYGFFESGATLIASCDRRHLAESATLSLFLSFAILATTIQIQDFQDCEGDTLAGRHTFPIVFPMLSRYITPFFVISWSIALCFVWKLDAFAALALILLGTVVGFRCAAFRKVRDDEMTYFLYNGWLLVAFSLPIYRRVFGQSEFTSFFGGFTTSWGRL